MHYKRMPIEIEAPEGYGYENIDCNLSESSFTDQRLSDLGINAQLIKYFQKDRNKTSNRCCPSIHSRAQTNKVFYS